MLGANACDGVVCVDVAGAGARGSLLGGEDISGLAVRRYGTGCYARVSS